jgi:hypothetical protein
MVRNRVTDLSCVVEPTHMRVAGGEKAIRVWMGGVLLDRQEQFRHGLCEAPAEKMRVAYLKERRADSRPRAEAQRGIDMFDRDVGLTRPIPEGATEQPTAREIRVERQGTVDQCHHGVDVLAKIGQRNGGNR